MSDLEDSDIDVKKRPAEPFAFLSKIKSNTPRARFDVNFFSTYVTLTQYSVKKEISNQYVIRKENITKLLRLPYNNGKQFFIVLQLKHPVLGGNKSFTKYDFIVFSFLKEEYEDISVDLSDPIIKAMFSENDDNDDLENGKTLEGKTVDVFETLIVKIFEKSVTTPASNYIGNKKAPGLQCTFWDNDEHFLYPLDNGFVNVWKYCQIFKLDDVKNVRFIRSKGRFKTFDFLIYPRMERTIRRYHVGSNESKFIHCSSLEFQAIDQKHYGGLYDYCQRNDIEITTNDFKESASEDSNSDSDNEETQMNSGSHSANPDSQNLLDDFDVPDPHLTRCQTEGNEIDSESITGSEESSNTSDSDQASTSESQKTLVIHNRRKNISDATDESSMSESDSKKTVVFRHRRKNISDNTDQSSSSESQKTIVFRARRKNISDDTESSNSESSMQLQKTVTSRSSRKRSLRIESDDEIKSKIKNKNLVIIDSD